MPLMPPEVFESLMGAAVPRNDYTLLRPFSLAGVARGESICDTRGRHVSTDAATEMVAQLGVEALRMAPECWLNGKPVYPDGIVVLLDGTPRRYQDVTPGAAITGWPEEQPDHVVELYVDGERLDTITVPWNNIVFGWKVMHAPSK